MHEHDAVRAFRGRIVGSARRAVVMVVACVARSHRAAGIHASHRDIRHHRHGHRAGHDRHQHDQRHGGKSQPRHHPLMCRAFQHARIPGKRPSLEQAPDMMTSKRKKIMRHADARFTQCVFFRWFALVRGYEKAPFGKPEGAFCEARDATLRASFEPGSPR
jgi:hypothetical protein